MVMMVAKREAPQRPFDPRNYSPEALKHWARERAPDLRVVYAIVDGDRRAAARWTFAGDVYEYGGANLDELMLEVASAIAQLLRIRTAKDLRQRAEIERAIVEAEAAGNPEAAAELGRQLVLKNAGVTPTRIPLRLSL
jgi:DNA-binding GntR family transcriptional regulator